MKLDTKTLSAVGDVLDRNRVPAEDRRMLFVIDGIDYRLDATGCWCFSNESHDVGWTKCALPGALSGLS